MSHPPSIDPSSTHTAATVVIPWLDQPLISDAKRDYFLYIRYGALNFNLFNFQIVQGITLCTERMGKTRTRIFFATSATSSGVLSYLSLGKE